MDSDEYYCGGSDDFRGYLWKIPEVSNLIEERREIPPDQWDNSADTTGFSQSGLSNRYVPVEISEPVYRLTGELVYSKRAIHSSPKYAKATNQS